MLGFANSIYISKFMVNAELKLGLFLGSLELWYALMAFQRMVAQVHARF